MVINKNETLVSVKISSDQYAWVDKWNTEFYHLKVDKSTCFYSL